MSNSSIASRILEIALAFERGESTSFVLNESIELHAPAFEGVDRTIIDNLNKLGHKLLVDDISDYEREMLGWDKSDETIQNIKAILLGLKKSS